MFDHPPALYILGYYTLEDTCCKYNTFFLEKIVDRMLINCRHFVHFVLTTAGGKALHKPITVSISTQVLLTKQDKKSKTMHLLPLIFSGTSYKAVE